MRFTLEQHVDIQTKRAINRRYKAIEDGAGDALWWLYQDGEKAREKIDQAFITAARSIGQSRRQRNQKWVSWQVHPESSREIGADCRNSYPALTIERQRT